MIYCYSIVNVKSYNCHCVLYSDLKQLCVHPIVLEIIHKVPERTCQPFI